MTEIQTKLLVNPLSRTFELVKGSVDEKARTATFSFSSSTPYEREFGFETLSHKREHIDTSRLDAKACPFLLDHNWEKQIGKIVGYEITEDKAYATVKFSRSKMASEALGDMADDVKTEISVGYLPLEMKKLEGAERTVQGNDETAEYLVTKWQILEVSLVSVPADYTVGVGRNAATQYEAIITSSIADSEQPDVANPNADPSEPKVDKIDEVNPGGTVDSTPVPDVPAEVSETVAAEITTGSKEVTLEAVVEPVVTPVIKEEAAPVVEPAAEAGETKTVVTINVEQDRALEVARHEEIRARAKYFGASEEGEQFIRESKTVEQFNAFLLDSKMSEQTTVQVVDTTLGQKPNERKQYNLLKAINESAFGQRLTGYEAEMSQEMERLTGRKANGFFVPDFALTRDLSAGTFNAGGATIQTSVEPSLIPLLRNKMVVGRAGATMMSGLVGNLELPRQTGAASATWQTETGAPGNSSQTFDQVSLSPQRLSAVTAFSKQLLAQSQLDVQGIVRDDLLKIVALAQDNAALQGTGTSNQPVGILNTQANVGSSGVYSYTAPSVTFASGYPTWTNIVQFEGNVENLNVDLDDNTCAYIVSPAVKAFWKTLAQTDPRATNQFYPKFLMEEVRTENDGRCGMINGYKAFATNQLNATNQVIFGKFSDLVIGTWGGLDLITDPYTLAANFQVRVIVNLLCTVALRYGPSFCYSSNSGLA
jgi:HK97 family phage major capsid protein